MILTADTIEADNVRLDLPAAEAGLALLEPAFADGVIAHQGQWLGGESVVSFDRQAVALLQAQGIEAQLLTSGPLTPPTPPASDAVSARPVQA